jgi:DHA2 family multidrug resistance protein
VSPPAVTASPAAAPPGAAPRPPVNKWLVAITVAFGAFMAVMDVSVVNVSLPHMMGSFGQDLSSITWVATSYSIAEVIMATMAGWWSTLLGRKRFYMISFVIFTIGSILCGTATTFTQMVIYRTLQGVGGGTLIPVSQAILRETFPREEQGMAMAVYGMGVVLAPASGPILGGWLTDALGWPWIFYVNVPVSILGIIMVWLFVHDPPYLRRGVRRIDFVGIGLLGATLTTMQVVLERGQEKNWFDSPLITAGLIAGCVFAALLVWWELRVPEPVVSFRLLKNVPLSVGSAMGGIFGVGLIGTTFILPQFTQELLGYPAFQAGLILAPRAFAVLLCMPIAGWLYQRVDPRLLVAGGIMILIYTYTDLSKLSLATGSANLIPLLLIMGAGMPFMFVTLSSVSLSTVPRHEMTEASSIYTLTRTVGGNIGYALIATLVARGRQIHRAVLTTHVSLTDPNYAAFHGQLTTTLRHAGLGPAAVPMAAHAITDRLVERQATMLAYNDVSLVFAVMFVCALPLVIFLPRPDRSAEAPEAGGH